MCSALLCAVGLDMDIWRPYRIGGIIEFSMSVSSRSALDWITFGIPLSGARWRAMPSYIHRLALLRTKKRDASPPAGPWPHGRAAGARGFLCESVRADDSCGNDAGGEPTPGGASSAVAPA
eukprot:7847287-Pyramimonas_sp.AAC.1